MSVNSMRRFFQEAIERMKEALGFNDVDLSIAELFTLTRNR